MSACPSADTLAAFVAGGAADADALEEHLDQCAECLSLLARLAPAAAAVDAETHPQGGSAVERFQVIRLLGEGGMGAVYEALDRERGARVALKTILALSRDRGQAQTPRGVSPRLGEQLLRFKNEFRALADISHPNLVRLLELIEQDGALMFTMELVDGVDLLTYVRKNPSRLAAALLQLCDGLLCLHRAGKIHRDIKPSNVLVTATGRVVILDFGLIVDTRSAHDLTGSQIVGTAAYMAPEQADAPSCGPQADWYSVGVMLYQALCGELPFSGPALELLLAKKTTDAPPLSAKLAALPDAPAVAAPLVELCMSLLCRDPALRPRGEAVRQVFSALAGEAVPTAVPPALERSDFVGRQAELKTLAAALCQARAQGPVTVLVTGESGIGKSALCRSFLRTLKTDPTAAESSAVLAGRCYERETISFKAVDEVIDSLSRHLAGLPETLAASLLPRRAALLTRVFPVLSRIPAFAHAPPQPDIPDRRELAGLLTLALRELLLRLCERSRVVLFIDDLQWADPDSLLLLADLLRPPDAPPLLLLCTVRPEARPELPGDVRSLPLGPLSEDDGRALATHLAIPAHAAARFAQAAAGHPLFLRELALHAAMSAEAPRELDLKTMLRERICQLPPEELRLLQLSTVASSPLPWRWLGEAAGRAAADCEASLLRLRAANLLRTTQARGRAASFREGLVEPYHDRIREATLSTLSAEATRGCHQDLAAVLLRAQEADPEALAYHLHGAGDDVRAAQFALRAAERAMASVSFLRAVSFYRCALSWHPPQQDSETASLRARVAEALALAGRGPEAAAEFLLAAKHCTGDAAQDLKLAASDQLLRCGRITAGLPLLAEALRVGGFTLPTSPQTALARLLAVRAQLRLRGLSYKERPAAAIATQALRRVDLCWAAGNSLFAVDVIARAEFLTRHLLLALAAGEPGRVARGLSLEGLLRYTSVDPKDRAAGEALIAQAESIARRIDDPMSLARTHGARAMGAMCEGRWHAALSAFQAAEELNVARCQGTSWELDVCRSLQVYALWQLGRLPEMSSRVTHLLQEGRERGHAMLATLMTVGPAIFVWLARDDAAGARRAINDSGITQPPRSNDPLRFQTTMAHCLIDLYVNDPAAAWSRLTQRGAVGMIERVNYFLYLVLELRARCALALAQQAGSQTRALLRSVEQDAERLTALDGNQPAAALAELFRAGAAALRGDNASALRGLRKSIESFDALAMPLLAACARRRLAERLGGAQGQALDTQATDYLIKQGVRSPAKLTALLCPA